MCMTGMGIGMALCLVACGNSEPNASDISVRRERMGQDTAVAGTEGPTEENSAKEKKDTGSQAARSGNGLSKELQDAWALDGDAQLEGTQAGETKPEDTEEGSPGNGEEAKNIENASLGGTKKGIVFGSPEAFGCKDFKYLTEGSVSTEQNGSKKEERFSAYIPKEEKVRVSGASARGERAGVYVKVDLEPYLQYKAETYSLRSNLDKYVTGEMDYYDNFYDVIVGNIEEAEDVAVCEVTYMEYDFYEDAYSPYYIVYSLHDLGDNVMALVTLSIDADNTTEETGELLEELASFYQLDIHWDETFAQAKREKFEDKYTGNIYSIDCLTFKLPDGWEVDEDVSSEYETFYAPGGDSEEAGMFFGVSEVLSASGMVDMFLEDKEEMQAMLEEEFENELDYAQIQDIGMTFLGRTFTIEMTLHDGEEAGNSVIYMAEDDNNLYMLYAFSSFGEEGESIGLDEKAQEAVTMFFETGRVTDSFA